MSSSTYKYLKPQLLQKEWKSADLAITKIPLDNEFPKCSNQIPHLNFIWN